MIRPLIASVTAALALIATSSAGPSAQAPAAAAAVADTHMKQNSLYREFRTPGIRVGTKSNVPLPPNMMPDGLDPDRQMAVLSALVKDTHPLDEFLKSAVDAPFVVKVLALTPVEPGAPVRHFSVAFVAHGSLDRVVDSEFRARFASLGRGDVEVTELKAPELAKRNIALTRAAGVTEFYTNYNIPLYDRVQLSETKHNMQTRSPESVVIASLLDPRFTEDLTFPNSWQRVLTEADGDITFGAPLPYHGAASYLKLTRLAKVPNAMFGEFHVAYTEPPAWFNGTNFLSSKIPILARTEIQGFRRELTKARASQP